MTHDPIKAHLAAEYVRCIGYDPFADDPSRTVEEVRQTLTEWCDAVPNQTLYNCCPDYLPPDWSHFSGFEVQAMQQTDTCCLPCEPWLAEFWTVYGRERDGCAIAITDVTTERLATTIAGMFAGKLRG